MEEINRYVGQRIHFFRKLKGKTLQELAQSIGKSKATLSKYEKSEIAIDVEVLFDIAQQLEVSIGQLVDYPLHQSDVRPARPGQGAFSNAESLYLYSYDGRNPQVTESLIRILPTVAADRAAVYMDIPPDASDWHECRSYYLGSVEYHATLISFVLQNQFNEAEKVLLYLYNPIDREQETPGLLCGLARQNLQPVALRCLASLHRLRVDEKLRERLMFNRQELHTLRKLNLFTVKHQPGAEGL